MLGFFGLCSFGFFCVGFLGGVVGLGSVVVVCGCVVLVWGCLVVW